MDTNRFDGLTRSLRNGLTRRGALGMLAGATLGQGAAAARKKKKPRKKCRNCCRASGSPCTKKNAACKPGLCPRFTVTASWDSDENHDTYLFVPNDEGASASFPFFDQFCNICEEDVYPFACVNQDAEGPGDEVTSIFKLLPGTYEYWLELDEGAPAGDATVTLRDKGRLVFTSTNPANPSAENVSSWHVFNLRGSTGRFTEIDEVVENNLPRAAHSQNTYVCAP